RRCGRGDVLGEPALDAGAIDPVRDRRAGTSLLPHESAAKHMRALLVDFGGVLTTSIWSAFGAFCEREGLERDAVRNLFRSNPEALALLRGLETSELEPAAFELRFAELLDLAASDS